MRVLALCGLVLVAAVAAPSLAALNPPPTPPAASSGAPGAVPAVYSGMRVSPAAPLLPSNTRSVTGGTVPSSGPQVTPAAELRPSAPVEATAVGLGDAGSSLGTFEVPVSHATRVEGESGCCQCEAPKPCPCANPCEQRELTKGELLERRLDKIKSEITEKSMTIKSEGEWIEQVKGIIARYREKISHVKGHIEVTKNDVRALFAEKQKLEAEILRVRLDDSGSDRLDTDGGFVNPKTGAKEFASEVVVAKDEKE